MGREFSADADYIKISDVQAVRGQLGSRIVAITGVMNNFDRMIIEGREEDVAIIGSDEYYPQVRNLDRLAGRMGMSERTLRRRCLGAFRHRRDARCHVPS